MDTSCSVAMPSLYIYGLFIDLIWFAHKEMHWVCTVCFVKSALEVWSLLKPYRFATASQRRPNDEFKFTLLWIGASLTSLLLISLSACCGNTKREWTECQVEHKRSDCFVCKWLRINACRGVWNANALDYSMQKTMPWWDNIWADEDVGFCCL